MDTSTLDTEDLARFALGKRVRRNTRIRRALLANLINEQAEPIEEETENIAAPEGEDEERQLVRLLAGGRLLKKRRLRRLVLAHLLSERGGEPEEFEEGETEEGDEGGENDNEFIRLLIGHKMLRRRRVRRALLAYLIKQRSEPDEDVDVGEDEFEGGEDGSEGKFVRMVVGSRLLRRRRVRRALIAHLLKQKAEEGEGFEDEEEEGEDGIDLERQVAKLLVGRRMVKKGRVRRAALAKYLREQSAFD